MQIEKLKLYRRFGRMNRLDIIQIVINRLKAKTFLEIGIKKGKVFLKVKARKKMGIDPIIKINRKRKIVSYLINYNNIFNEYFQMTSDSFFALQPNPITKINGVDVVFIDGLHTYKQSLRDVQNCLSYLNRDGVIIMHDCNPLSEAEAQPANSSIDAASANLPGWTGAWCGDVWKTVVYLRSIRSDLQVFVLNCDHGVGIISWGKPENLLNYSAEEIDNLSYKDLDRDRKNLINLKEVDYLDKLFLNK
jgi:hypothetical protein